MVVEGERDGGVRVDERDVSEEHVRDEAAAATLRLDVDARLGT